jgi:hypothetical protein
MEKSMAKNQNTFAKRQRESAKKFKAEEKLKRRQERKLTQGQPEPEIAHEEDSDSLDIE